MWTILVLLTKSKNVDSDEEDRSVEHFCLIKSSSRKCWGTCDCSLESCGEEAGQQPGGRGEGRGGGLDLLAGAEWIIVRWLPNRPRFGLGEGQ